MNILLAGLGRSNLCLKKFLEEEGHSIKTFDDKKEADYNYERLKKEIPLFDRAYITPGLYYNRSAYKLINLLAREKDNELGYALKKIKDKLKIIAITGSNGKTSTAIFLQYLLQKEGYKVLLAGNIGVPLSEFLLEIDSYDVVVLEISSFQAQELNDVSFDVLVITSISSNHLDAYHSIKEYYAAKKRLLLFAKTALFDKDVERELGLSSSHEIVEFIDSTKSKEKNYNLALNVLSSLEIDVSKYLDFDYQNLLPPSRYSPFYRYRQLEFVDDSKSTSYAATLAALNNSTKPTYLILGGHMKSYFKAFGDRVEVLIYGKEREKFIRSVGGKSFSTLDEVVAYLKDTLDPEMEARILFSPGGSSIDYPNYQIRGREFQRLVRQAYDNEE